jgi:hypothetical protein
MCNGEVGSEAAIEPVEMHFRFRCYRTPDSTDHLIWAKGMVAYDGI